MSNPDLRTPWLIIMGVSLVLVGIAHFWREKHLNGKIAETHANSSDPLTGTTATSLPGIYKSEVDNLQSDLI